MWHWVVGFLSSIKALQKLVFLVLQSIETPLSTSSWCLAPMASLQHLWALLMYWNACPSHLEAMMPASMLCRCRLLAASWMESFLSGGPSLSGLSGLGSTSLGGSHHSAAGWSELPSTHGVPLASLASSCVLCKGPVLSSSSSPRLILGRLPLWCLPVIALGGGCGPPSRIGVRWFNFLPYALPILFSLTPGWVCHCVITHPLTVHFLLFDGEHPVDSLGLYISGVPLQADSQLLHSLPYYTTVVAFLFSSFDRGLTFSVLPWSFDQLSSPWRVFPLACMHFVAIHP